MSAPAPAPPAGSANPRGIPYAPFVDRVEEYVASRAEVEPTLKSFAEMIQKYQFMEASTGRRAEGLREKIPDIRRTLEVVRFLGEGPGEDGEDDEDGKGLEVDFELNDTLFARASVALPAEEVYLWLGANVMLAYPIGEADALLEEKLTAATTSLGNCEEDLDFLREQITTLEVATARVYNWDVGQRRRERLQGDGNGRETDAD